MATERFIENNVIRNRERLGLADAPFIRRCRAGRGYGIVDLLFLPASGAADSHGSGDSAGWKCPCQSAPKVALAISTLARMDGFRQV